MLDILLLSSPISDIFHAICCGILWHKCLAERRRDSRQRARDDAYILLVPYAVYGLYKSKYIAVRKKERERDLKIAGDAKCECSIFGNV